MCEGGPVCMAPNAPTDLTLTAKPTAIDVSLASAMSGPATARFDIRYRLNEPITDTNFAIAVPSSTTPPPPGLAGSVVSTEIGGLNPQSNYYVAARAVASCGATSPIVTAPVTTLKPAFVTLHGCFIATAAYGTPMAAELTGLRRLRDRHLLRAPLGQVLVASYYALSPPLARAIASDERLRAAARRLLAPLVELAGYLD
jgi:hypothetical protein